MFDWRAEQVLIFRKLQRVKVATLRALRNQSGFSLVELMVASGLVGLLAVATMKISDINMKSLKRSEASLETQSIVVAITNNLLNGESCVNTLSPVGGLSNGKNVTEIRNRVNRAIFNTTDSYGTRALKIKSMKVRDLDITPSTIPAGQKGYGELNLLVRLERLSSQISVSSKIVEKKIPLKVEVDSSKRVLRCYAATENAVDTAKAAACNNIGGVFDSATDECDLADYPQPDSSNIAVSTKYLQDHQVELDDKYVDITGDTMTGQLNVNSTVKANQFCVGTRCRDFKAQNCSPGQMVEKIRADGTLVCKGIKCVATKYFEGFDTSGNPICKSLPTGSCSTNQYIKKINVDGTVECANVPYHWGVGCSPGQYIQKISSDGTPTCKAITGLLGNIQCPADEFIYRHQDGTFSCRSPSDKNVYGKSCPDGKVLQGFNENGGRICVQMEWPSGSYCIARGSGACPAGFTRKDGYLKAIKLHASTSVYIDAVQFGASNLKCHGDASFSPPCTYDTYGELNLSMCCK